MIREELRAAGVIVLDDPHKFECFGHQFGAEKRSVSVDQLVVVIRSLHRRLLLHQLCPI